MDNQRWLRQNETTLDEKTRAFDYANVSYQMALSNVDRANRTSGNVNSLLYLLVVLVVELGVLIEAYKDMLVERGVLH